MKKLLSVGALCTFLLLSACADPNNANEVLVDAGYKDIRITGWSMFGCGKDDTYSTGFVAISPGGRKVEGVVCSGFLFKGATIRITGRAN